jgi:translation initiation factor IF-1
MGVYAVGDRFKIPSQWLAPGQVVYGKVTKVLPHHVVVVREDNGKEQQFPAVTKGSIVTNSNAYSNVKKGDRVSVKGAKKYDALSPDTVSGEVLFVHPDGKVAVRVGSGQMNVLPQDIVNAYSNGRQKAETYLNSRAQAVGVENASPGAKFTVIYKGKTGLEVSRAFGAYYIYKDGKSYEFMRLDQAKRAADTGDMSFGFVQRPLG